MCADAEAWASCNGLLMRSVKQWGKKLTFVINKADTLSADELAAALRVME